MPTSYMWNSVGTSYAVGANWTNVGGDAGSGPPASGDTAKVPRTAIKPMVAGLSQSAVTLARLHVERGCNVGIGAPGSPLNIGATNYNLFGAATVHLQPTSGNVLVNSVNNVLAVRIYGGSAINYVLCGAGKTIIGDSGTIAYLAVASRGATNVGPSVEIMGSRGSTFAMLRDGDVLWSSTGNPSSLMIGAASLQMTHASTIDYLYQSGGLFRFSSASTIADATIMGGTFDGSKGTAPRTISLLRAYRGARIIRGPFLTVTTEYNFPKEIGLQAV